MAGYRKLGRQSDQRKAILRNLTTALIWNGTIVTTEARAKEVRKIAEKLVTLAVNEYDNTVEVTKDKVGEDGNKTSVKVVNDAPSKLAARRQMMEYLYEVKELKQDGESKLDYKERTKDVKHPAVEKLFREYGPKYAKRAEETGTKGGYTRIIKKGPRRGDAAEMVILQMI